MSQIDAGRYSEGWYDSPVTEDTFGRGDPAGDNYTRVGDNDSYGLVAAYPGLARNSSQGEPLDSQIDTVVLVFKSLALCSIILAAIVGNVLVVISVFRFERLRIIANSFIVSLAFADLLVALLVMPFSASIELGGKWVFGKITCDIFNGNDVLFSTASLLHLCCISMDRYIAITDPFHYESRMTRRRVVILLCLAWGASALISHIPIHTGWYTTAEQYEIRHSSNSTDQCPFEVNIIYGVISSTVSFWTPAIIMVFTYIKIYREARKQEAAIHAMARAVPSPSSNNSHRVGNGLAAPATRQDRNGSCQSENSRVTQDRRKLKREHKAAKTLGIIMGAFLLCWLPFFIHYVATTMCGDKCHSPPIVVSMLFWIGYFNSALNPVIYAFFNRDFRHAFKKLLGCDRLPCRRIRRSRRKAGAESAALSAQHFAELQYRGANCSSRSSTSSSPKRASISRRSYEAVHQLEVH